LVEFAKEAVVRKTHRDFKERSKAIIAGHIISVIQEKRKDPNYKPPASFAKSFKDPELALAALNDNSELNDEFKEKVSDQINDEAVTNMSYKFAD